MPDVFLGLEFFALKSKNTMSREKRDDHDDDLVEDLGEKIVGPTVMVTDSKSGCDVVVNPGATKHTVHFERWLHWARSLQLRKIIKSVLVGTDLMRADDKTKVVDKTKFAMCRRTTMNLDPSVKDFP